MAKNRTQKAALNTITAAALEIVQLVCGLIIPRLILSSYGSAYNGITSSARQFLSALSILTLGISGATRFALYRSLADNDIDKTSRIVRATEKYMRKVGFILLGYLVVLIIAYPLVIDTGYSWIEVAPLILAAGISAAGRYFFGTTYTALLLADQRFYIANCFTIVAALLDVILSVILIKTGCSIQVVTVCSSLVLVMSPVLRALYVRTRYKLNRKCEPDTSALKSRKDIIAHSIANMIHEHTDVIVLTVFCNVKIVSVYTTYNLVMSALKKTQRVFTGGTEAIFGNMWAKGETDHLKKGLENLEYFVTAFVSIAFAATSVLLLPFISLYTKGVHDVEYILPSYAVVITTAQMFFSFRTPYVTLVQGIGHYRQTKNGAYTEAIVNIVVSIVLVQFVGIVGVAIGTLVANIFRTVQYIIYIDKNVLHCGILGPLCRIVWSLGNIVFVYYIAQIATSRIIINNWMNWLVAAIVITLISVLVTIVSSLLFYRKDFKSAIQILKRSMGKRKH